MSLSGPDGPTPGALPEAACEVGLRAVVAALRRARPREAAAAFVAEVGAAAACRACALVQHALAIPDATLRVTGVWPAAGGAAAAAAAHPLHGAPDWQALGADSAAALRRAETVRVAVESLPAPFASAFAARGSAGLVVLPAPACEGIETILVVETAEREPPQALAQLLAWPGFGELFAVTNSHFAAVETVRRDEARYRELFDNASDLVWAIDLAGRFTTVNQTMAELLGYEVSDTVGRPWEEFIPGAEQHEVVRSAMRSKLEGRRERTRYEVRLRHRNGTLIPVEVSSRLVVRNGEPIGVQGSGRDLSEARRLEEQLRQAVKLEAAGRFAAGIANEFTQLVGAITGYGERLLSRLKPTDPLRAEVLEILRAGERAGDLTRELLAFGRQQPVHPSRIDLNGFLAQKLPTLRRIVSDDVVVVDLTEERVGRIHVDTGLLEQLCVALFVNARDAMPEGGRIEISTAVADAEEIRRRGIESPLQPAYVRLSIRDSGHGIDPASMARLFEPFFSTRERGRGSGLGLSTVYGIVKQCDGFVFADSHPGQGSVFHVYFPQVEAPLGRRSPSGELRLPPLTEPAAEPRELILLVEDEDLVRSLAEQILTDRGFGVIAAANAAEALEAATRIGRDIDLLLTDVVMPGMSGLDLAQRLQRRDPRLRVLFMSGYADSPLLRVGLAQGGAAFLQKPFSGDALERRIRELLER